jgi:hypothetical protein
LDTKTGKKQVEGTLQTIEKPGNFQGPNWLAFAAFGRKSERRVYDR